MLNKFKRHLNIWRSLQNPLAYWGHKYGLVKGDKLVLKLANGVEAEVPKRMLRTFKECVFQEDYFKGFPTGVIHDFETANVVDVGANVGYFSLWWLSRFPRSRVIAVEPMPSNFALLARNKSLNPGKNLETINCAMRHEAGHIVLNFDKNDTFTTSASALKHTGAGGDEISVKATSLERLMTDFGLQQIDFLKLDCEGSEYDILYHCDETRLSSIRCIAMETHPGTEAKESKEALCDFLRAKKFHVSTEVGSPMVYAHH